MRKQNMDRQKKNVKEQIEKINKLSFSLPDSFDHKFPNFDERFLADQKEKQLNDRTIWKIYSNYGGFYDTFINLRNTVEHPSGNAFDLDEEAGQYIFFLTLSNTYLKKITSLYDKMCKELDSNYQIGIQELKKERQDLQNRYHELQERYHKLRDQKKEFYDQYYEFYNLFQPIPKLWEKNLQEQQERQEQGRNQLEESLQFYPKKVKNYNEDMQNYNKWFESFQAKWNSQESYTPKYTSLWKLLKQLLYNVQEEGKSFHFLTLSPTKEEELNQYREVAEEFCKQIAEIMTQYPV